MRIHHCALPLYSQIQGSTVSKHLSTCLCPFSSYKVRGLFLWVSIQFVHFWAEFQSIATKALYSTPNFSEVPNLESKYGSCPHQAWTLLSRSSQTLGRKKRTFHLAQKTDLGFKYIFHLATYILHANPLKFLPDFKSSVKPSNCCDYDRDLNRRQNTEVYCGSTGCQKAWKHWGLQTFRQ